MDKVWEERSDGVGETIPRQGRFPRQFWWRITGVRPPPPPEPPPDPVRVTVVKEGQLCYAVADSGANILVAPFEVAESYNLPVFRWDSPVEILFGKQGSKSVSRFYAWMGPVLGKAALLTDAVGVLLPILTVAKRESLNYLFDRQRSSDN